MSPPTRIGLFLCQRPNLHAARWVLNRMQEVGAAYDQVKVVHEMERICSPQGLARLKDTISEYNLDGLVLAAGPLTPAAKTLAPQLAATGLDPEAIELVYWPEFLHGADQNPEGANLKAETVLRQAIDKVINQDRLQFREIPVSQTVMVVGHGWTALQAAAELAGLGLKALLVTSQSGLGDKWDAGGYTRESAETLEHLLEDVTNHIEVEIHLASRIAEFAGVAGQYRVLLEDNQGSSQEYQVGGVILAPEPEWVADFAAWDLTPSDQALSLADLETRLLSEDNPLQFRTVAQQVPALVLFLLGFTHTSSPVSQQRAYRAALRLVESHGLRVLVLLDHFKVADEGLEALSQKARQAGIIFAKIAGGKPEVETANGNLTVRFFDEVMNQDMLVKPQLIILEEAAQSPEQARELAKILEIQSDSRGFIQGDEVYNLPIYTNRTGVLAVGPARGPIGLGESFQEVREAALHLFELLGAGHINAALDRVKLDQKKCAICLTCYRLCPHRAISVVNRRPLFSDLACKVCGICASECPMGALQIHNYNDRQFQTELKILDSNPDPEVDTPLIVAFACRNSAREAARLAVQRKLPLPRRLEMIEVPCAGKVDPDYILTAFKQGADGVMVLACHPESCKSFQGSPRARQRVALLHEYLAEAGLEPDRLVYGGLAPGMSQEFARLVQEMAAKLLELGNSPLRQTPRLQKSA